jgi:hypothetical protein
MSGFQEVILVERDQLPRAEIDDSDWHNGQGESPDDGAGVLQLAHRVLAKFPDLPKRHRYQKFIGTAAVASSVLVGLITIAVNRRLHRGESAERILEELTPDEIVSIAKEKPAKKPRREKNGDGRFLH